MGKNQVSDDKKIQQTLKKFSCSNLPGIDEVNMFKEDGNVIHFKNPKVTASPSANTFTVAGHNEVKKITEIPGELLITYYLLLTTDYLLPATYYLLLTTYCLLPM